MATPSISELVKRGTPIYVQNLTRDPRAVLTCTFHTPGRKPQSIFLPAIDHPVKLYPGMLSESALLEGSEQLQRFLKLRALKLVPPKKARAILADPEVARQVDLASSLLNSEAASRRFAENMKGAAEARKQGSDDEEYYRGPQSTMPTADLTNNPIAMAVQAALASHGIGEAPVQQQANTPSRTAHQLDIAGVDPAVNVRVLGLMAGWSVSADESILLSLKSLSGLSAADFNHIVQNSGKDSSTWSWAASKISQ